MTEDIATLKAYVIDLERKVHKGTHSVEEIEKEKILIIHLISLHLNRLDTLHFLHNNQDQKNAPIVAANEVDHGGEERFVRTALALDKYPAMRKANGDSNHHEPITNGISFMLAAQRLGDYNSRIRSSTDQAENNNGSSHVSAELHHQSWLSERISRALQDQLYVSEHLHNFKTLTKREREVIGYVTAGYQNKEIAALLGITLDTVKQHRKAIRSKLGLDSIAALVRFGLVFNLKPEAL
jgi:DNA-binding CsgD family transcriptional regulator